MTTPTNKDELLDGLKAKLLALLTGLPEKFTIPLNNAIDTVLSDFADNIQAMLLEHRDIAVQLETEQQKNELLKRKLSEHASWNEQTTVVVTAVGNLADLLTGEGDDVTAQRIRDCIALALGISDVPVVPPVDPEDPTDPEEPTDPTDDNGDDSEPTVNP